MPAVLLSRVVGGFKRECMWKSRRGESLGATWLGRLIVTQDLWYSVMFYNIHYIKITTSASEPTI